MKILKENSVDSKVQENIKKLFQKDLIHAARVSVKLYETFVDHSNIFNNVSSEYKRFNLLKDKGYAEPLTFSIGSKPVKKLKNNEMVPDFEEMYGVYFPLEHS